MFRGKAMIFCLVTVWFLLLTSHFGNAQQCEDFPGGLLIDRFAETTTVGTILWTWSMDLEGSLLIFEPLYESDRGFLELDHSVDPGSVDISIRLAKSLNLIDLNPRPPPYPNTEENVDCPYNRSSTIPPSVKTAVTFTLRCISQINEPLEKTAIAIIEEVNDNAPYFMCSPYYKNISEYMVVDSTVFTLRGLATDPEIQGDISGYAIAGGADNTFAIRGSGGSGNIVLLRRLDYNFGKTQYILNVTVEDTGTPPLSNWTYLYLDIIDEDDLNPIFDNEIYEISLEEMNPNLIGIRHPTSPPVFAYDQDFGINATVRYDLIRGHVIDGVTYFAIDEDSGFLIPLVTLDREDIASFTLVIEAYQVDNPQKRTAVAGLVVTVEDVNDHPPAMSDSLYSLLIPENMPNGLSILQVFASDPDEGDNAVFEFRLVDDEGAFSLDPITGMLFVSNSDLLDRERKAVMDIKVYAQETLTQELWRSGDSIVAITLVDQNDNSPIFYPSYSYTYTAQTPLPADTTIGWVSANDTDEGPNAVVRYSLRRAFPDYIQFRVDPVSGVIYLEDEMSSITENLTIALSLSAQDQAPVQTHRRSTECYVTVYLLGVDLTTTSAPTTTTATTALPTSTSVPLTSATTTLGETSPTSTVTPSPTTSPSTGGTTLGPGAGDTTSSSSVSSTRDGGQTTDTRSTDTSPHVQTTAGPGGSQSTQSTTPSVPAGSSQSTQPSSTLSSTKTSSSGLTGGTGTGETGTGRTVLPSCLPPIEQTSERDTFLILAIVFGALMLLFALALIITACQLYRVKRLREEPESDVKDASQMTNLGSSISLTCKMTDDNISQAPSLAPSLGTERSTLRDNVYATIKNQVVQDGIPGDHTLTLTPTTDGSTLQLSNGRRAHPYSNPNH